jgi:hypothetical protein
LFSELPHHRVENLAIAPILSLFGARFEISVEPQDRGIIRFLSVSLEDVPQATEDSIFPVDESAVAIESKGFEPAKVEHQLGPSS